MLVSIAPSNCALHLVRWEADLKMVTIEMKHDHASSMKPLGLR